MNLSHWCTVIVAVFQWTTTTNMIFVNLGLSSSLILPVVIGRQQPQRRHHYMQAWSSHSITRITRSSIKINEKSHRNLMWNKLRRKDTHTTCHHHTNPHNNESLIYRRQSLPMGHGCYQKQKLCTNHELILCFNYHRIRRINHRNSNVNPCIRFHSTTMPASSALAATTTSTPTSIQNPEGQSSAVPPIYIGIIGGGASGIFASIAAANVAAKHRHHKNVRVIVLEATTETLRKVKISGGGRCNVLHDTSITVSNILQYGYPNGSKELKSIYYQQFTPQDAQKWFEQHGVILKTEPDGRMFPITDTSQTIIDTLINTAIRSKVVIYKKCPIQSIISIGNNDSDERIQHDIEKASPQPQYQIVLNKNNIENNNNNNDIHRVIENIRFDAIILATGSSPVGYKIAKSLGHNIIPPVPSLFTVNTNDPLFHNLAGISVDYVKIRYKLLAPVRRNSDATTTITTTTTAVDKKQNNNRKMKKYMEQDGPILITHTGLSGPAILRLSAFGSREFYEQKYTGTIIINWLPTIGNNIDIVYDELWKLTSVLSKRIISSKCPFLINLRTLPSVPGAKIHYQPDRREIGTEPEDNMDVELVEEDKKTAIPRRLWYSLVQKAGIPDTMIWGSISKKLVRQLATVLYECSVEINGKNINKDEFVTAGGIDCSTQINMKTMSSTKCPGIYFCGEIIHVDGITGGFNFMSCWSTGYVAGTSAAQKCLHNTEFIEKTANNG